jgi:catechol 2,3-dioxygenase-like lactoylglutathione lyase family enzyme
MLGRFLEFSLATPDIAASLEFYTRLGFSQAQVGDTWRHPYAVLTDGRIHIGLHQDSGASPQITFVKPQLLQHVDALEQLGLEFEFRRLGNDVFNEIGWRDPSAHRVRLVEARTFSPAKPQTAESACGRFLEIALPSPDRGFAKAYWERLGFVGIDEPDARLAHVCCMSDTINIGLYAPRDLPSPALVFDAEDVPARLAELAQRGIESSRTLPGALPAGSAALFTAPEGTPILVYSSAIA